MRFETINNIKRFHKGHWFNADTMNFFKSKVYETVIDDGTRYLFLSSEKGPSNVRSYTIRTMAYSGNITTGDFQKFRTKRQAEKYIEEICGVKNFIA